jgi:hypothetical protein
LLRPYLEARTIAGERRIGIRLDDGAWRTLRRSEAAQLLELPRREQRVRHHVPVRARRPDLGDEEVVAPERIP